MVSDLGLHCLSMSLLWDAMLKLVKLIFAALLEAEVTDGDIESMKSAKNMYKSCIDEGKNYQQLFWFLYAFLYRLVRYVHLRVRPCVRT